MLRHRHDQTQVLTVKSGVWDVTLNDGDAGPDRAARRPGRAVRAGRQLAQHRPWSRPGENAAAAGTGELLVVNGGDGRVRLEWAPEVVDAAFEAGWMLDPNGYLAPVAVMVTATIDD